MLDQNFMSNLTPVEVEFISACISKVYKQKVTSETQNFENLECVSVLIAILSILSSMDTSDRMAIRDICVRTVALHSALQRIHSFPIAGVLMKHGQNSLPVS